MVSEVYFSLLFSHKRNKRLSTGLAYRGQMDASRPESGTEPTGEDLSKALDALLAGRRVAEQQTPSLGCNIKWKEGNEPQYFNPQGTA